MIPETEIRHLVEQKIRQDEQLGERAGGSGHLSDVGFHIDSIEAPIASDEGYRVAYRYSLIITTEFTCEPDNPPYRETRSGVLIIKEHGTDE